jgi:hypothetical protein
MKNRIFKDVVLVVEKKGEREKEKNRSTMTEVT